MRKLFTFDNIMVAFISALGYGFGETIARLSGWPELACMGASFGLGLLLEKIISTICFSKAVQKNRSSCCFIRAILLPGELPIPCCTAPIL